MKKNMQWTTWETIDNRSLNQIEDDLQVIIIILRSVFSLSSSRTSSICLCVWWKWANVYAYVCHACTNSLFHHSFDSLEAQEFRKFFLLCFCAAVVPIQPLFLPSFLCIQFLLTNRRGYPNNCFNYFSLLHWLSLLPSSSCSILFNLHLIQCVCDSLNEFLSPLLLLIHVSLLFSCSLTHSHTWDRMEREPLSPSSSESGEDTCFSDWKLPSSLWCTLSSQLTWMPYELMRCSRLALKVTSRQHDTDMDLKFLHLIPTDLKEEGRDMIFGCVIGNQKVWDALLHGSACGFTWVSENWVKNSGMKRADRVKHAGENWTLLKGQPQGWERERCCRLMTPFTLLIEEKDSHQKEETIC